MMAFAACQNSGGASVPISSVSSEPPRGGRASTPRGAAIAAVGAGRKALELVVHDTEVSYLANNERQLAIERLLIRFGEALKSIPNQTLTEIDPNIAFQIAGIEVKRSSETTDKQAARELEDALRGDLRRQIKDGGGTQHTWADAVAKCELEDSGQRSWERTKRSIDVLNEYIKRQVQDLLPYALYVEGLALLEKPERPGGGELTGDVRTAEIAKRIRERRQQK